LVPQAVEVLESSVDITTHAQPAIVVQDNSSSSSPLPHITTNPTEHIPAIIPEIQSDGDEIVRPSKYCGRVFFF
jgi:hypothetical protein